MGIPPVRKAPARLGPNPRVTATHPCRNKKGKGADARPTLSHSAAARRSSRSARSPTSPISAAQAIITADQVRTRSSVQLHFVIGLAVSTQFLTAVRRARFRRPPTPAGGAGGRTTLARNAGRPSSAPRKGPAREQRSQISHRTNRAREWFAALDTDAIDRGRGGVGLTAGVTRHSRVGLEMVSLLGRAVRPSRPGPPPWPARATAWSLLGSQAVCRCGTDDPHEHLV
jgi:hypothetical protein